MLGKYLAHPTRFTIDMPKGVTLSSVFDGRLQGG
jgi:hypothetical protein